jgi:hypothetical protein
MERARARARLGRTAPPPPDYNHVRTRRDLARIINEAVDPLLVKQEILEEQQQEPMDYDNEDNFLEVIGPDLSMEEDEALLDENEEEEDGGDEGDDDEDDEGGHEAADGEGRGDGHVGYDDYRNDQLQGEESRREVITAAAEGPAETAELAAVAVTCPGRRGRPAAAAVVNLLRLGEARMVTEVTMIFRTTWRRKTTRCSKRRWRTSWTAG